MLALGLIPSKVHTFNLDMWLKEKDHHIEAELMLLLEVKTDCEKAKYNELKYKMMCRPLTWVRMGERKD